MKERTHAYERDLCWCVVIFNFNIILLTGSNVTMQIRQCCRVTRKSYYKDWNKLLSAGSKYVINVFLFNFTSVFLNNDPNTDLKNENVPLRSQVLVSTIVRCPRCAEDVVQVETIRFDSSPLLLMETLQIVDCSTGTSEKNIYFSFSSLDIISLNITN